MAGQLQLLKSDVATQLSEGPIEKIKKRQETELVFALCGPLGSRTDHVSKILGKVLEDAGYGVRYVKASEKIIEYAISSDFKGNFDNATIRNDYAERINLLQLEGNALREKKGTNIIAQKIVHDIHTHRFKSQSLSTETPINEIEPRKFATIIDSLKHPDEVDLFELVYGDMFYMFGVLCSEHKRIQNLISKNALEPRAKELIDRDKSESIKHGQQVLDTIHRADFFVGQSVDSADELYKDLQRFIRLILGEQSLSPTITEYGMFTAYSASLRSACLSRQVGAAIFDSANELIATGRNDVPQYGGGLYTPESQKDGRCHSGIDGDCINDREKGKIKQELLNSLLDAFEGTEIKAADVKDVFFDILSNNSKIDGLLEFSRAVHAEMDAITSAARVGSGPLRGGTLYTTTYPCHHCARHIVASGISRVIYIEPYEKSLATLLHEDSIACDGMSLAGKAERLSIVPFQGVAPRQFVNMFSMTKRKKRGKRIEFNLREAKPIIKKFIDSYLDYESFVFKHAQEHESIDSDDEKS